MERWYHVSESTCRNDPQKSLLNLSADPQFVLDQNWLLNVTIAKKDLSSDWWHFCDYILEWKASSKLRLA